MKQVLSIFSFFLFLSFKPEKEIIIWQENKLLTWNDFKGKPAKRFAAASTHYNIFKTTEQFGSSAQVNIEAIFYCYKSWKKESWLSEGILEHEQKHFDIAELFSRKLRKLVSELKYRSYSQLKLKSDSLYDVIDKTMDIYQDKYDDETNASMNAEKQKEWNRKIKVEIESLSEYKSTEFTVMFAK